MTSKFITGQGEAEELRRAHMMESFEAVEAACRWPTAGTVLFILTTTLLAWLGLWKALELVGIL